MKIHKIYFLLPFFFLLLSCSSKSTQSPPSPSYESSSSTSRAEFAAQKAEDSAIRAEAAARRAEAAAGRAEEETGAMKGDVKWQYEKGAIRLRIVSDPQLNLYQGGFHTLLVCVYQLKAPNSFNRLIEENEGLSKLLECSPYDASALSAKRLVIQPDSETTELLDRAEDARYVGIVAGYYLLKKENVTRLFKIPLVEESRGSRVMKPAVLNINLYMGPQEMREAGTR